MLNFVEAMLDDEVVALVVLRGHSFGYTIL
jgi:hypothetical protein